jgi:hypothetical protein
MQTILKVSLYFIQLITAAKVVFYRNVIAALTGNVAFPNPPVTLSNFATEVDTVEGKSNEVAAAKTALVLAEWQLQQAVDAMDASGRALAGYVGSASMNNPATLESSGFSLTAPPTPVGILPPPTNLRAMPGLTGTALLRWNRERGGTSWLVECAENPSGPWTQIYSGTRATCVATDLTPGAVYWFRVKVLGAAGWSDWSDPVMKRAV